MKLLFYFCISFALFGCSSEVENNSTVSFKDDLKEFRKERNKSMASSKSPLAEEYRKHFVGLNFYPANDTYQLNAKFELLFSQQSFKMKTNTDRQPNYIPYGRIEFNLYGSNHNLIAYKSLDNSLDELFIPFNDLTNGDGSYATGRYIDIPIPEGDSILLDFNRCYNPYCAYNSKYSCPIPPSENNLNIQINAGEGNFHK